MITDQLLLNPFFDKTNNEGSGLGVQHSELQPVGHGFESKADKLKLSIVP